MKKNSLDLSNSNVSPSHSSNTAEPSMLLTTLLCTSVYSIPQYVYHLNNYTNSRCLDATVCN